MAPSDVEALRELLNTNRRTLAFQLQQLGQHTPAYAPPALLHGIANAQSEIARLKQALRAAGESVADEPNDSAPVHEIIAAEKPVVTAPLSEKEQKNRAAMLQLVRATWIDVVLKQSLWNEARIALQLTERPDAVARPYGLTLQKPSGTATPLPATTRIIDLYDEQRGALLILGAPGGGKTTLLLELAETLLERVTSQPQHAIPVVFNLSSWGEQQPALADWLVAQLNRQYDVPRTIAQAWVDAGVVLPLLDGLDEVADARRAGCVNAINTYRVQHEAAWDMPIVVCCREKDYDALPQLRHFHAVAVQALTRAQVDKFLRDGGRALTGVRAVVKDDATLYELLDTPLLLSIVTLAFAGQSATALRRASTPEERRRAVFDAYVERVFAPPPQGKGNDPRYPRERMLHYLAWLARQMQQRSESIFYLERIQSAVLHSSWKQTLHLVLSLATTLLGILCAGGVAGLIVWWVGNEAFSWSSPSWRYWLGYGLIGGSLGWVVVVLLGLPNRNFLGDIEPNEVIQWVTRQGIIGMMCGITIGLISGWYSGLIIGVFIGIIFGSIGIAFGVRGQKLDQIHNPNEGIRRTFWNAASVGSIGLFIVGTVITILGTTIFSEGLVAGLTLLLVFGVGFGLGLWAISGGTTVVKHYTLRLLLWLGGALPWNIAAMLDAAAQRTLLRRVGGGWVFVHRMLLEYFAALDASPPAPLPKGRGERDVA